MNDGSNKIEQDDIKQGGFYSLEGICSLRRYWIHFLISILIVAIDYAYAEFLCKYSSYVLDLIESILCCIILLGWNIHLICLCVQRFRSIGINPWCAIIPIFGSIIAKIIPSRKNKSNNKYLTYEIPFERLFKTLILAIGIAYSGIPNGDAIIRSIDEISKSDSGHVLFQNDSVICTEYNTKDGKKYIFNIFRYNDLIIDTLVFYKPETLEYLKNRYKKLKESNSEKYLDDFSEVIFDLAKDYPYIELCDSEGETIKCFTSEKYENVTSEIVEEYGAKRIRYWYYGFDEIIEDL